MQVRKIVQILITVTAVSGFLLYSGCDKNPVGSGGDNENAHSQTLTSAAASGTKLYHTVNSVRNAEMTMMGTSTYSKGTTPDLGGVQQGVGLSRQIAAKMHQHLDQEMQSLSKTMTLAGERILWDFKWRDNELGISYHAVLFYDDQTGRARAYQVAYDYAQHYDLEYDSTHFEFDLNFTIDDSTDDVFLSLDNLKRYKLGFYIQTEETHYDPDDCAAGQEPTGGKVEVISIYAPSEEVSRKREYFESHSANSGIFRREMWYADESFCSEEIVFNADGTGTYEEVKRNNSYA